MIFGDEDISNKVRIQVRVKISVIINRRGGVSSTLRRTLINPTTLTFFHSPSSLFLHRHGGSLPDAGATTVTWKARPSNRHNHCNKFGEYRASYNKIKRKMKVENMNQYFIRI